MVELMTKFGCNPTVDGKTVSIEEDIGKVDFKGMVADVVPV